MPNDYIVFLLGEWAGQVNIGSIALKTALIVIMSVVLGCERSRNRHAAGLRTFIVLSIASLYAGIGDLYFITNPDLKVGFPILSAAVFIGISIITANTIIFSSKNQIMGLTTSVSMWAMSILSSVLGFGLYTAALIGFIVLLVGLLAFSKMEKYIKDKSNHFEIHLELQSRGSIREFVTAAREFGLTVDNLELNPAYANSGLSVYTVKFTIVKKELRKKSHSDIVEALSVLDCVYYIEQIG